MYGYVFQYGNENIDIGSRGTNLNTDSYSLALYGTKIEDNDYFTKCRNMNLKLYTIKYENFSSWRLWLYRKSHSKQT